MDVTFHHRMEEYYQRFIDLQEKLRKSEEERLKLEIKFNELLQRSREEEQAHYRKLRSQYKRFLDEDRKRQDRNEKILRALERIETRVNSLMSKTDRFRILRRQYQAYLEGISNRTKTTGLRDPAPSSDRTFQSMKHENPESQNVLETEDERKMALLDKYLQNFSSNDNKLSPQNSPSYKKETSTLNDLSKKISQNFDSNKANSIAEDIMKSIYNRHYKKSSHDHFGGHKVSDNETDNRNAGNNYSEYLYSRDKNKQVSKQIPINGFHERKTIDDFPFKKNENIANFTDVNDKIFSKFEGDEEESSTLGNRSKANGNHLFEKDHQNKNSSKEKNLISKEFNGCEQFGRDKSNSCNQNEDILNPVQGYNNAAAENGIENLSTDIKTDLGMKNQENYKMSKENNSYDKVTGHIESPVMHDNDMDINSFSQEMQEISKRNGASTENKGSKVEDSSYQKNVHSSEQLFSEPKQQYKKNEHFNSNNHKKTEKHEGVSGGTKQEPLEVLKQHNDGDSVEQQQFSEYSQVMNRKHNDEHDQQQQYEESRQYDTLNQTISQQDFHENVIPNIQEQYDEIGQPIIQQRFDEHNQLLSKQFDENKKPVFPENDGRGHPILDQQHDESGHALFTQKYDDKDQPILEPQYDENNQPTIEQQYDENGQPILQQQYDESGQTILQQQYDENGQPILQQYDENGQPIPQQQYDENGQPIFQQQYDKNGQPIPQQQYDEHGQPILQQQYDENGQPILQQQYNENGQPIFQHSYDENGQAILQQKYDENGQPIFQQQYDENGQPIPQQQYDENNQPILQQQYDENGQPILQQQYYENGQPILQQQYDENGLPIPQQQYDENGQPILQQQYDENGQPIPQQQYDENGQSIVQQQYDENGQPLPQQQYDENEQPILQQQYDENGHPFHQQQYDVNGQPIYQPHYGDTTIIQQQYDENGQLMVQQQYDENNQLEFQREFDENDHPVQQIYKENVQPMQQYDEYGQINLQYDEKGQSILQQQYDSDGQPPVYSQSENNNDGEIQSQYDENGQVIQNYNKQHYENGQLTDYSNIHEENVHDESVQEILTSEQQSAGEDLSNPSKAKQNERDDSVAEIRKEGIPTIDRKKSNVLELLDTDTESVKQNTSKISNDSDFDFSNG